MKSITDVLEVDSEENYLKMCDIKNTSTTRNLLVSPEDLKKMVDFEYKQMRGYTFERVIDHL